jgi:signal transduction histidine kinase
MPLSETTTAQRTALQPEGGAGGAEEALAACQAQLHALTRQQELLAYGISHDLRAPLRAIDQFSALLQRQGERLDEGSLAHVQRIRDAAARMGALIEALLEYSRVDRAELARAPVDLSLQAELVLAELQEAEPGRALQARVAPQLWALGDEAQLHGLMRELLRNAWRFSGDLVEVEVGGERHDGRLRLWVRDRGRGFDPRYADKLFEPFQRLHRADEGSGSGLGLATAARIAARHDGRLWAQSTPGAGSTFFAELPAATPNGHPS